MLPPNMTSRDYTKEIGVNAGSATIPLPYALVVIAAVLTVGGFGLAAIHRGDDKQLEVKDAKAVVTAAHSSSSGR